MDASWAESVSFFQTDSSAFLFTKYGGNSWLLEVRCPVGSKCTKRLAMNLIKGRSRQGKGCCGIMADAYLASSIPTFLSMEMGDHGSVNAIHTESYHQLP